MVVPESLRPRIGITAKTPVRSSVALVILRIAS